MLFCLKHVFRYLRLNKLREKVSFPKKISHCLAKRANYDEDDKEEDASDGAKNHSRTEVGLVVAQKPPDERENKIRNTDPIYKLSPAF